MNWMRIGGIVLELTAERQRGRIFNRNFLLVCLTSTADSVNASSFLPTLPLLMFSLGGGNAEVGLLLATYSMAALGSRLLIGPALDRFGRKPFLVVGTSLFLLANLLYFTASSATSVLLLRTFQGVGFGVVGTTMSVLIADLVPMERRGEAMAYSSIFAGVPQALAPGLAFWLIAAPGLPLSGFPLLFAVCSVVAMIELLLTLFVGEPLHRSVRNQKSKTSLTEPNSSVGATASVLTRLGIASIFSRDALPMATTMFFVAIAYSAIASFLPLYLSADHAENVSIFLFVNSGMALISRPFVGLLSDRIGRRLVVIGLMLLYAIGLGILAISSSLLVVLVSAVVFGVGFGSLNLILNALVVDVASPAKRGPALATFIAGFDIGISLGSIALGQVAGLTGYRWLFLISGGVALIGLAQFLISQRWAHSHRTDRVLPNPALERSQLSTD